MKFFKNHGYKSADFTLPHPLLFVSHPLPKNNVYKIPLCLQAQQLVEILKIVNKKDTIDGIKNNFTEFTADCMSIRNSRLFHVPTITDVSVCHLLLFSHRTEDISANFVWLNEHFSTGTQNSMYQ